MKRFPILLILAAATVKVFAQSAEGDSTRKWRFSGWAEMFVLPEQRDIFNPTFYARTQTLHLEGRYNYEDVNTASFWAGRRFLFGKSVKFVLVPMAAVVVGNINGVSTGVEVEMTYRKFDFYSESEFVFDLYLSENNFYYQYGEIAARPFKPLRTGLIIQRTKLVENDLEFQRGVFAEYYYTRYRAGLFAFSPLGSNRFWIVSFSVDF